MRTPLLIILGFYCLLAVLSTYQLSMQQKYSLAFGPGTFALVILSATIWIIRINRPVTAK